MPDCAALSSLPRDFGARALRFAPCYRRPRREFGESQLLGCTYGETLGQSFIPGHLIVGHSKNYSPRSRRKEFLGLIHVGFLCSASSRSSPEETSGSSSGGKQSSYVSPEEFYGSSSRSRGEKERDRNGDPLLSTFDFLELKRELEKEESASAGSAEEGSRQEVSEDSTSSLEKEGIVVGSSASTRCGRQVMRRSNLLAKQVISMESARSLGFVSQLWVDTRSWTVVLVEVRSNFLSGDAEKFLLEDIFQVGDVVLVQDESVMENKLKLTGLDTLVGYDLVKPGRRSIGKIRGYTYNINTGAVETLEFDSFGFSIIPSSLVSTYCLLVEDVLDVEPGKVIVHEEALSHVQRLTKGFWDAGNIDKAADYLEMPPDFRRKRASSYRRGRSRRFNGPQSPHKVREDDDGWDLPMDY